MSDAYQTSSDIEARLNQLCDERSDSTSPLTQPEAQDGRDDLVNFDAHENSVELLADESVRQHLVRSSRFIQCQHVDTLKGLFRCHFEASQTTYVLHVPVYPLMESAPTVETLCDHDDVTIRVTQAKTFGLRLELKRGGESSSARQVIVQLTACAQSEQTDD